MKPVDHYKDGLVMLGYTCDELGVELSCWFVHEPAERGARSRSGEQLEPDYPATWSLWHAYLPESNVDLCPVMHPKLTQEIEESVASNEDDNWRDGDDDRDDDR